jgi:hypothetical protein
VGRARRRGSGTTKIKANLSAGRNLPWRSPWAREDVPSRAAAARRVGGEIGAKKGLPSADRNNKATLPRTGPFRTAKSSAKDLIPRVSKLQYANHPPALRAGGTVRLLGCEAVAYSYASTARGSVAAFWHGF